MAIFADDKFKAHVSKEFSDALENLPDAVIDLSEVELKSLVKPTPLDYALKTSFWREYNKAEAVGGLVSMRDVYGGITTINYFKNHVLKNHFKLAWMCRPTQIYEKEVEALLNRGTERLWELLDMDIYKEDGTIDTKKGYLVLDVIKMVEQRAKGLAVQRVQSVNVNIDQQKAAIQIQATDDVDKRIKELEAELKTLPPQRQVIDVRTSEERILEAVGVEEETEGDAASSLRD
jgi:hypothetical protein